MHCIVIRTIAVAGSAMNEKRFSDALRADSVRKSRVPRNVARLID